MYDYALDHGAHVIVRVQFCELIVRNFPTLYPPVISICLICRYNYRATQQLETWAAIRLE